MISRLFARAALLALAAPTLPPSATDQAVPVVGRACEGPTGAPLPEVQVYLVGANRGAITRRDGTYSIVLDDGWLDQEETVRFERIGYAAMDRTLTLAFGDNRIDVATAQRRSPSTRSS